MKTILSIAIGLLYLSCIGCAATTPPAPEKCVGSDSMLHECGVNSPPTASY